jgi:hypothetical protein
MFLFLAINEYNGKCRLWLIGSLLGLAMASRPPAGLNILMHLHYSLARWQSRICPQWLWMSSAPRWCLKIFMRV